MYILRLKARTNVRANERRDEMPGHEDRET